MTKRKSTIRLIVGLAYDLTRGLVDREHRLRHTTEFVQLTTIIGHGPPGLTEQELAALLIDLADTTGVDETELADAAFYAIAGAREDDLRETLLAASRLANTGFVSLDAATDTITTLSNLYNTPPARLPELLHTTTVESNQTMERVARVMLSVGPVAVHTGRDINQVADDILRHEYEGVPETELTRFLHETYHPRTPSGTDSGGRDD